MSPKAWIVVVALLGASAVGIGAFQAHGLEKWLEKKSADNIPRKLANCETAVRYQMFHTLAILALVALNRKPNLTNRVAGLFVLGIGLFSGGLYLIVFAGTVGHWAIVPAGGLILMVAWLSSALLAIEPKTA